MEERAAPGCLALTGLCCPLFHFLSSILFTDPLQESQSHFDCVERTGVLIKYPNLTPIPSIVCLQCHERKDNENRATLVVVIGISDVMTHENGMLATTVTTTPIAQNIYE